MKLHISIVVSSDDDTVSQGTAGGLMLATRLAGVDPSSAKQDFLAQAETLMRSVSENQLPALYQTVLDESERKAQGAREAQAAEPSPGQAKVHAKLAQLRQKKEQAAQGAQDTAQDVQNAVPAADDPVKCTECGAEVPHDDAHYVSVVVGGKYDRDAVLCDKCYDKVMAEMRSASAGPGPETDAVPRNGEGE